jgi:hypothetical protein
MFAREWLGHLVGSYVAPAFAAGSRLRGARLLHPRGVLHRGEVRSLARDDDALMALGDRLAGPAIVRFSSALFRGERAPDLLGLAVRFCSDPLPSVDPDGCDQDLLFATMPGIFRLPAALVRTDVHDFLANDYYGALSFDVDGIGRAKLRVRPEGDTKRGEGRERRLAEAVAVGDARLVLEIRRRGHARWSPVVAIDVGERLELDDRELRFVPYLNARGIRPVGFVHAMRGATYAASAFSRKESPRIDDVEPGRTSDLQLRRSHA